MVLSIIAKYNTTGNRLFVNPRMIKWLRLSFVNYGGIRGRLLPHETTETVFLYVNTYFIIRTK